MKKALHFDKELTQWQSNDSLTRKNNKLLQKIHLNEKKNTLTQKSIDKRKSRPSSSPIKSIEISSSINQLRLLSHHEEQKSEKIKNRLKYLFTANQRQQKLVNSAKLKFNKIKEIRRQSFTDKSFFQKQRENLTTQYSKTVYLKASKVKIERNRTSQSQKKIIIQKHNLAKAVKEQKSLNESFIQEKKKHEKSILQSKVRKIHQQEHLQKQKSAIKSKQKIQQGIMNHKKDILTQYQKIQRQLKANEKIMKVFKEKADKICDKKIKQQQMLEQFRDFLGLNKSELNFQSPKSPSFYHIKSARGQKDGQFFNNKKGSSTSLRKIDVQNNTYLTNPQ